MYLVTMFLLAFLFPVEWMIKLFMLPQTWKMVSLKRTCTMYTYFALMMGCIWHVRMFLRRFISNLRKRQLLTLPTSSLGIPSVPLISFSCPAPLASRTLWKDRLHEWLLSLYAVRSLCRHETLLPTNYLEVRRDNLKILRIRRMTAVQAKLLEYVLRERRKSYKRIRHCIWVFVFVLQLKEEISEENCSTRRFCFCVILGRCTAERCVLC